MKTLPLPIALRTAAALAATSLLPSPATAQEGTGGWADLFNGTDLSGWVMKGGKAKYSVANGEIVGTTVPNTPNSFLCTEKAYGDFILELEFKVHPELNSGVMVRAQEREEDGRVNGYQIEIDPGDRAWTGGFYDEARRGWQDPLTDNPAARHAFRPGDWNQFRIEMVGDSVRTFLNGVPAADGVDSTDLSGFIGLQVHGVGKREDPLEVRFRKIRIKDLGVSKWRPLLDGDIDGFKATVPDTWSVREDGVLRGKSPASEKRHSIFLSDKVFENFTTRLSYRAKAGNSGLYFRCDPVKGGVGVHGFQAEIDAGGEDIGGLYETGGRAWVSQPDKAAAEKAYKKGDWNEMTVSAHGQRHVVHVNGTVLTDILDPKARREGHLGFQLHGGQDMDIEVRSFEILQTAAPRPVPEVGEANPATLELGEVRKLADGFTFTEGPAVAPDGKVYFSDIPQDKIHVHDPATGKTTLWKEGNGNTNGLMFTPSGALVTCETSARQIGRHDGATGEHAALVSDFEGKRFNKPNDLALDGKGGIYFTDPVYGKIDTELDFEGVYYLPRRGKKAQLIDKTCTKPNGIALSHDGKTLYVVDNGAKEMVAYDVVEDGYASTVENRRVLCALESDATRAGDGMAVDAQGHLFVTVPEGIAVFDPAGKKVAHLDVPEQPTNCIFGRGDDRTALYITARSGFYAAEVKPGGAW